MAFNFSFTLLRASSKGFLLDAIIEILQDINQHYIMIYDHMQILIYQYWLRNN